MSLLVNFQQPLTDNFDKHWKTPLALAIGLHLLVLALSMLPPSLFYRRHIIPEAVTINLFTVEELKPAKPSPVKRQPAKPTPPKEIKKEKPAPLPPPPQPKPQTSVAEDIPAPTPPAPEPAKAISMNPRKIKKKVEPPKEKIVEKPKEDKQLKALERIQARVNQKKELEKTKHDLAKLRESLHVSPAPTAAPPEPAVAPTAETGETPPEQTGSSAGQSSLIDMAAKQYHIAVARKITDHWVLPEMQKWDEKLEAIYIIVIRRDGIITKSFFEQRSSNEYFNQFVEKTVQAASPMPHFPADLKKSAVEIGLIFHPSGLF